MPDVPGGAILLVLLLILLVAAVAVAVRRVRAYRASQIDHHEGATETSPLIRELEEKVRTFQRDELIAAYGGRHHREVVERLAVPADYQPVIGRRRIALETETQRMELPR